MNNIKALILLASAIITGVPFYTEIKATCQQQNCCKCNPCECNPCKCCGCNSSCKC